MTTPWSPITLDELTTLVAQQLTECDASQRRLFARHAIVACRWSLHPWGDEGGGFWVLAIQSNHALWYNDIEDGFDVASFDSVGFLPSSAYSGTQDSLAAALDRLASAPKGA